LTDGVEDFSYSPVGRIQIVPSYVLAYVVEICERFWLESIPAPHACRFRRASVFALRRAKASSPPIGFPQPFFICS
jgi:hypothetical protein